MANISTKIIDGFVANRLVEKRDGRLVWSEKMAPHFIMTRRGGPLVWRDGSDEPYKEEASEFFARICMLSDHTLY